MLVLMLMLMSPMMRIAAAHSIIVSTPGYTYSPDRWPGVLNLTEFAAPPAGVDDPEPFHLPSVTAIVLGVAVLVPLALGTAVLPVNPPRLDSRKVRRFRWASIRAAISSRRWRMAMQNCELARMRSPCQRKRKGMMHMRVAKPPRREQAPAMPRRANMGAVARGRTVARREREHDAAALAEAAKISYASVR